MSKSKLIVIILALSGVAGGSCFAINKAIKPATQNETIKPAPDLPGAESYGDDNYGLVHYGKKNFGIYKYDEIVELCQIRLWNVLTGNKCETIADLEAYEPNKWKAKKILVNRSAIISSITNASKDEINSQENFEFWKPYLEDLSVDTMQYRTSTFKKCIDRKDSNNKCTLSDLKTYARIDTAIGKFKKWLFPETEEQKKSRYEKFKQSYQDAVRRRESLAAK